jgi:glycosyltransferase involved in cell wall biosynthesis
MEPQPLECIVVDDGSRDETCSIARQFGARVITTGGRKGPAHARNLGAREAVGDVVFFIDADVCVHRDAMARVISRFAAEPDVQAIIGSYDDSPHEQDVLSMYRNLLHRYVHQNSRQDATTFWGACGAIRRDLFLQLGGFDEGYGRPAIEDIEMGYRLYSGGHRIVLDRALEVKHLKRWSFLNLMKTDIFDRGIPWTELILRDGRMPNDLNLQISQRVSVALASVLFGFSLAVAMYYKGYFVVPLLATMLFALACYWTESGVAPRRRGVKFTFAVLVLVFVGIAYAQHMVTLIPPVVVGYLLLFIRYRYTSRNLKLRKLTGVAYAAYLMASLVFICSFMPARVPVFCFYVLILSIVGINHRFYFFLGRRMGWITVLAAVPFHMLFYFYSGISFLTGVAGLTWKGLFRSCADKVLGKAAN